MRTRSPERRILVGILFSAGGMAGLVALATLAVGRSAHADLERSGKGPAGETPTFAIDNKCGCPRNGTKLWSLADKGNPKCPADMPTRCLKENDPKGDDWRPVNDEGVPYPQLPYPSRFPDEFAMDLVPFPGWPKCRVCGEKTDSGRLQWLYGTPAASSWTDTLRNRYREWYVEKKAKGGGGGMAPGTKDELQQNRKIFGIVMPAKGPWYRWQIHHILEQSYGGRDYYENLVPAYSSKRATNEHWKGTADPGQDPSLVHYHQQFTNWWEHITVDADIVDAKLMKDEKICKLGIDPSAVEKVAKGLRDPKCENTKTDRRTTPRPRKP